MLASRVRILALRGLSGPLCGATIETMAGLKYDMKFLEPPTFKNAEEERLHRKRRLAASFRLFSKCGFDEGVAGHITVRDPVKKDHFWVNPFGVHFALIRVSDLILVNHDGVVVEGERAVTPAAFAIHSRV